MTTQTADTLDAAFAALADPTRRAIVSRLARGDATVTELAAPFAMSLPGISKHLKVLERSGLISRRRDAQFRPCHLEAGALDGALDWITTNRRLWDERFDKLDALLADLQPDEEAEREAPMAEHGELHFSRVFDAPRELVFACMTDPEHLAHFWGPAGVSAPRDRMTVDARPGGVFETVMVNDADGSEYPTSAVYDEVRAPELLRLDRVALGHAGALRVRGPRPPAHRGQDPSDLRARGVPGPRGPGRVPLLARSLRRVSRRAGRP